MTRMLTQPAPDCPGDGGLCPWLWEVTGQRWLAENSHLALVPLRILMIVVAAVALRWLLHRAVARLVRRSASGEAPVLLRPLPERVRDTVRQVAALRPERRRQRAEAIGSVLRGAITVAVFAVATLLVLSELDLDLAPLLAGAGIVGVALGFGAQSLVRDLLAGVFMLLEDQYGVGDSVDLGEVRGIVEAVGLRITTVRDLRGVVWYIPNGEIRRVGNRSQSPAVVVVDMPVGFASVPTAVEALRRGAQRLADDPDVRAALLEPPQVLGVNQVTMEGAVARTTVTTTPDDQWRVARELRRRQTEELQRAGIAAHILAARFPIRDAGTRPPHDAGTPPSE